MIDYHGMYNIHEYITRPDSLSCHGSNQFNIGRCYPGIFANAVKCNGAAIYGQNTS